MATGGDGRGQRTSKEDDPDEWIERFFSQSRLHYIGSFNERLQDEQEGFLRSRAPPPPLPPALPNAERVVFHLDMVR